MHNPILAIALILILWGLMSRWDRQQASIERIRELMEGREAARPAPVTVLALPAAEPAPVWTPKPPTRTDRIWAVVSGVGMLALLTIMIAEGGRGRIAAVGILIFIGLMVAAFGWIYVKRPQVWKS